MDNAATQELALELAQALANEVAIRHKAAHRTLIHTDVNFAQDFGTNPGNLEQKWDPAFRNAVSDAMDMQHSGWGKVVQSQARVGERLANLAATTVQNTHPYLIPDIMGVIRFKPMTQGATSVYGLLEWVSVVAEMKRALTRSKTIRGHPINIHATFEIRAVLCRAVRQVEHQVHLHISALKANRPDIFTSNDPTVRLLVRKRIFLLASCGPWFVTGHYTPPGDGDEDLMPNSPTIDEPEYEDVSRELPNAQAVPWSRWLTGVVPSSPSFSWDGRIQNLDESTGQDVLEQAGKEFRESFQNILLEQDRTGIMAYVLHL